jgi:indolepyruvate ferredoxin oxidoreductase
MLAHIDLEDRYAAASGPVLMTGVQALVRLLIEQRRLDARRGLNTAAFISGYPGSPLGGLDREIARAQPHLEPAGVVFEPGVNEELAATAVSGTQRVPELPGRQVDGVTGFWYGKAPGLDRAADAIRHGNTSGTTHLGGAVALIGDDPLCKSSTLPSSCETMAESLVLPLFSPASVSEIVRLGLHAVAMSREAGLWTAIKIISDVADSTAAVELQDSSTEIPMPPAASRGPAPTLLGASAVAAEHDLLGARLNRARDYGRDHELNRVVFEPSRARTTVIAPGPTFGTVARALEQLGLDEAGLESLGIRLVSLELVWPIHPDDIQRFCEGVDEVVVVEDKRPFVERQLRDALYGAPHAPAVLGKRDACGRPLIPMDGSVGVDVLARALARLWADRLPEYSQQLRAEAGVRIRATAEPLPMVRTPFFCSGCPHNLSTRAADDQLVGAGIGCHALIALDPAGGRGQLIGAPQMGGEGAQWMGMAPFTNDPHYTQNLGDGTFHHSGSLAIRAAVAAKVTLTYRLLYNDAIAMTGGQTAPGRIGVVDLTKWLQLEGVRRVIVTTEDPESFAGQPLAANAEVRHRDELEAAQAELAAVKGVTVLIHTDRCATEERRLRKRGKLPAPAERVWINERVCEGCGDCGEQSSCLSVVPVATEFGRKTQIHQSSCTQDLACLKGDCPSFVVVTPGKRKQRALPSVPIPLPEPVPRFDADGAVVIRMPGIGGTGVVTVSQILQMAALLEGRWASGLDQTGLAQKGGAVISDIRIAPTPSVGALRAASGEVDLLLGLDLLGTVGAETLNTLDQRSSVAVVNLHETATAAMVTDTDAPSLPVAAIVARVEGATRPGTALWLDAGRMAEALFADHMPTNLVMLGAAYQHGCLPVGADAIEEAIRINGAGVDANLAAFAWGRAAAVDREAVEAALAALPGRPVQPEPETPATVRAVIDAANLDDAVRRVVEPRAADLVGYQDPRCAMRYVEDVAEVARIERERLPSGAGTVTEAYARNLYKLTAYKDEYEVARLHLDSFERAKRDAAFGPKAQAAVLLHPPALRTMGLKRKIRLRRSAVPLFTVLRAARRLRGSRLDPFGAAEVRRVERALVGEYRATVRTALRLLDASTRDAVVAIASLPDMIRGYEDIKLANVERYREAVLEGVEALA